MTSGAIESGDVKKDHPGILKNLCCYISEFCQNTSLHGLKFLGEKGRSIIEKIWWLIIISASLYCCGTFIRATYNKWQNTPVIVNFATSPTPIWKIPFPVVTICPETKANRTLYNYTEKHFQAKNVSLPQSEFAKFQYINAVCVSQKIIRMTYFNKTMLDFLNSVFPSLDETLWHCKWYGKPRDCRELFVQVITDVGICYSFNILDHDEMYQNDVYQYKDFQSTKKSNDWTPQDGYVENDDVIAYPERALFAGMQAGLSVNLFMRQSDKDHFCTGGMQGYKVHLHYPSDVPSVSDNYFKVGLDQSAVVEVKPRMMYTNEKLYNYHHRKRNCYFMYEKPLRFFKVYSEQNCQIECLANFTLTACDCVPFHMPRISTTKVCGPRMLKCVKHAELKFMANEVTIDLRDDQEYMLKNKTYTACNCLPSCFSITYETEVSQNDWEWQKYYISEEFLGQYQNIPSHNSKIIVFFKEKQIMTYERSELYGLSDFIANIGGVLGLFIGFSIVSLMELVYFLTLRLCCNLRHFGRHYWSGNKYLS